MQTPVVAEVLEPFGADAEFIPLPELRDLLGVNRDVIERAKSRGVLTVAPVRGRNGRDQLTRSEAERLVLAVGMAAAAGVALVIALQVVKGNPWIAAAALKATRASAWPGRTTTRPRPSLSR
jgi:hypothetical protein